MKVFFKCLLVTVLFIIGIVTLSIGLFFLIPTQDEITIKIEDNNEDFICFYDTHNNVVETYEQADVTYLTDFTPQTKNAFIASEDKRFYSHHGVDYLRIIKAAAVNVKNGSFSQGASTITQQLVKNLKLSSQKTIARKLKEIKLAQKIESQYDKDEILAAYLNTIYFGENNYGIENAANYYFGKSEKDLTLSEVTLLCASIKSPSKINPVKNLEQTKKKQVLVLDAMVDCGFITETEKQTALAEPPVIVKRRESNANAYFKAALEELDQLKQEGLMSGGYNVYTDYDGDLQSFIESSIRNIAYDDQVAVISNGSLSVKAYHSTCGRILRNPASTIKPVSVYAKAIEDGVITQYTTVIDEPTVIDGYSVENYKNKYYGNVTARDALKQSLNVPSAKILNAVGINACKNALNKMDFEIDNASLNLSVGYLENGVDLITLGGAYATLANGGKYQKPHFITKITDRNGRIIYSCDNDVTTVYSPSTASVVTDMLLECTKSGTAKKLNDLPFQIAAKTGTFGNENGNTDAYAIAYTSDSTFAVWLGYDDSALMPNYVTGGGLATATLKEVVAHNYASHYPKDFISEGTKTLDIDKFALENSGKILLASSNTPEKYILHGVFKDSDNVFESSKIFLEPAVTDEKIFVEDNTVKITFNKYDFYNVKIYKTTDSGKKLVYEGIENEISFPLENEFCEYSIIPVYEGRSKTVYGREVYLPKVNGNANKNALPQKWWYE